MLTKLTRTDLRKRFFKVGYRAGRGSGKRSPDEAMLRVLEAQAIAGAQAAFRPANGTNDKRRLVRLEELDKLVEPYKLDRDRAALAHKKAIDEEAALGGRRALPSVSPRLRYGAAICLAISVAPTLHDLLLGLDPYLKWLAAGLAGWGVASFVVNGILPHIPAVKSTIELPAPVRNRGGLISGLVLGCGVLVVRLAPARSFPDVLLAVGMTVFELSAVLLLEYKAAGIHAEMSEAVLHNRKVVIAELATAAAKVELDRRQALLDQTLVEISEVESELEQDHELGDPKVLKEISVSAVKSGYERGISDNAGELGGVVGGPDDDDEQ